VPFTHAPPPNPRRQSCPVAHDAGCEQNPSWQVLPTPKAPAHVESSLHESARMLVKAQPLLSVVPSVATAITDAILGKRLRALQSALGSWLLITRQV
jgi:hypothetical protein